MPSRTYNPRLARNVAMAQVRRSMDLATPVEEALKPFIAAMTEIERKAEIEAEKKEKAQEKIEAEKMADFRNMRNFDPNTVPPEFRDYTTNAFLKLQQEYQFAANNLQGFEKIKALNEINTQINQLTNYKTMFSERMNDYQDRRNPNQAGGDRTSSVNDALTIHMDNRLTNREWDEVIEIDGKAHFLFKKDGILEEDVMVSIDEYATAYQPKERQTVKYVQTLNEVNTIIEKGQRELRWETDPTNIDKINKQVDAMTFTEDEIESIAVDQLNYTEEQFAGILQEDLDGDGRRGTLNDQTIHIKNQLKQGALEELKNRRLAYERNIANQEGDDKGKTAYELDQERKRLEKEAQRDNIKNTDFSNPTKSQDIAVKNPKQEVDFGTPAFQQLLIQTGFNVTGSPMQLDINGDGVAESITINVKNINTNKTATLVVQQRDKSGKITYKLTNDELQRQLLALAGYNTTEIQEILGPPKNKTLPGLVDPMTPYEALNPDRTNEQNQEVNTDQPIIQ